MIKETLEKWCETGELSIEMAMEIISEYLSLDNRTITGEQLSIIIQMSQSVPINWFFLAGQICNQKGWTLMEVLSPPNQLGQRALIRRYIY